MDSARKKNFMFRKLTLASCIVIAASALIGTTSSVSAADAVLDEFYGRGVHRYFAGDYQSAYEMLSSAIENGSQDPRAFYFRGLALIATGRIDEAASDWSVGARYEAQGTFDLSVGRSLARIQGPARVALEQMRQRARLEARKETMLRDKARYAPQSGIAPAPVGDEAVRDNPFNEDAATPSPAPQVESTDVLEGTLESAKAEAPAPSTKPGGEVRPAPTETPQPGDDPFGGDAPAAGDDPFGGS